MKYLEIRGNVVIINVTTQMNLDNIMPSEKN